MRQLVGYIRKSPVGKKKSYGTGLGVEAQEEAIRRYAETMGDTVVHIYMESERGKNPDRPELRKAMIHARRIGGVLVVARLDRMARNAKLFLELLDGGVDVAFCDFPTVPAGPIGRLILSVLAIIAEFEAGMISVRTKEALGAAKRRGVLLGAANPKCHKLNDAARERGVMRRKEKARQSCERLRATLTGMKGQTLVAMAERLNQAGTPASRGGVWCAGQVSRVLKRLGV